MMTGSLLNLKEVAKASLIAKQVKESTTGSTSEAVKALLADACSTITIRRVARPQPSRKLGTGKGR